MRQAVPGGCSVCEKLGILPCKIRCIAIGTPPFHEKTAEISRQFFEFGQHGRFMATGLLGL